MRIERRFQRDLCGSKGYLVQCLKPYRNPQTKVTGPFSRRDCIDAISDIVSKETNPGGEKKGLRGAFFADEMPHRIRAGHEMDVMADRLAYKIAKIILPALGRQGGKHRDTPMCNALRNRAFEVDGN